jgi:hypothetical protein
MSTTANNNQQTLSDASQDLANDLLQLVAMLAMTYGETGEAMRNMNDSLQDFYMWGLHDKSAACQKLADSICCSLVGNKTLVKGSPNGESCGQSPQFGDCEGAPR